MAETKSAEYVARKRKDENKAAAAAPAKTHPTKAKLSFKSVLMITITTNKSTMKRIVYLLIA